MSPWFVFLCVVSLHRPSQSMHAFISTCGCRPLYLEYRLLESRGFCVRFTAVYTMVFHERMNEWCCFDSESCPLRIIQNMKQRSPDFALATLQWTTFHTEVVCSFQNGDIAALSVWSQVQIRTEHLGMLTVVRELLWICSYEKGIDIGLGVKRFDYFPNNSEVSEISNIILLNTKFKYWSNVFCQEKGAQVSAFYDI